MPQGCHMFRTLNNLWCCVWHWYMYRARCIRIMPINKTNKFIFLIYKNVIKDIKMRPLPNDCWEKIHMISCIIYVIRPCTSGVMARLVGKIKKLKILILIFFRKWKLQTRRPRNPIYLVGLALLRSYLIDPPLSYRAHSPGHFASWSIKIG